MASRVREWLAAAACCLLLPLLAAAWLITTFGTAPLGALAGAP